MCWSCDAMCWSCDAMCWSFDAMCWSCDAMCWSCDVVFQPAVMDNLVSSMKYVLTGMGLLRINLENPKNRVNPTSYSHNACVAFNHRHTHFLAILIFVLFLFHTLYNNSIHSIFLAQYHFWLKIFLDRGHKFEPALQWQFQYEMFYSQLKLASGSLILKHFIWIKFDTSLKWSFYDSFPLFAYLQYSPSYNACLLCLFLTSWSEIKYDAMCL